MNEVRFQFRAGTVDVTLELFGGVYRLALHDGETCVKAELDRAQMRALSDNLKHLSRMKK